MAQNFAVSAANELQEIIEGLQRTPKHLPTKLMYDERGSKLFDEICELDEYYPTRTETGILTENIDEIASVFQDNTLLIEFGSGSSIKTKLLLEHLDNLAGYVPIDISEDYLNNQAEKLRKEFPGLEIVPLAADYTKPLDMPVIHKEVDHRITFFPGSTIGNFLPEIAKDFLKIIAETSCKNGGLLIGVDLVKDIKTLEAAYNDSEGVTAEFNLNLLRRINRDFNTNFNLDNFYHKAIFNEEYSRIEMRLYSKTDQSAAVNNYEFSIAQNEFIVTEYSHKYTPEGFAALASDHFIVEKVWTDNKNYFSLQYLSVK